MVSQVFRGLTEGSDTGGERRPTDAQSLAGISAHILAAGVCKCGRPVRGEEGAHAISREKQERHGRHGRVCRGC